MRPVLKPIYSLPGTSKQPWHHRQCLGDTFFCFFWCLKNNIQSNRGQKVRDYCLDDSTCMTEISIVQVGILFQIQTKMQMLTGPKSDKTTRGFIARRKYQLAAAKVADQRGRDDQFHWWGEIFGCLFFNKTWIQWTRPFFFGGEAFFLGRWKHGR